MSSLGRSALSVGAAAARVGVAGTWCGEATSRCMAWAKVGTAAMPLQLSPSVETSSLPRSCPSSSILMMTPGSKGPKTFPLRRRTWKRVTRPARGRISCAASSRKPSTSSPSSAGRTVAGSGWERSASRSSGSVRVGSNSSGSVAGAGSSSVSAPVCGKLERSSMSGEAGASVQATPSSPGSASSAGMGSAVALASSAPPRSMLPNSAARPVPQGAWAGASAVASRSVSGSGSGGSGSAPYAPSSAVSGQAPPSVAMALSVWLLGSASASSSKPASSSPESGASGET